MHDAFVEDALTKCLSQQLAFHWLSNETTDLRGLRHVVLARATDSKEPSGHSRSGLVFNCLDRFLHLLGPVLPSPFLFSTSD